MKSKPRIKVTLTFFDKMTEAAGWISLAGLCLVMIMHYIPSLTARPDNRPFSLVACIAAMGTYLLLTLLNHYPHKFNYPVGIHAQNAGLQYANATRIVRSLKLLIVLTGLAQNGIGTGFLQIYAGVAILVTVIGFVRALQEK